MKKHSVLVSAPYLKNVINRFRPEFEKHNIELIIPDVQERLEEDSLLKLIENIDGVICGDDRFTEKVLRAAPKLKVISKWGTGIDSIDHVTCKSLGIALCNTPNAFTDPVADSVFAYMLSFMRKTHLMDRQMKQGIWEKIPGVALKEKVLGVIGVGNVGKAVVTRACAFSMKVLGNDIKEIDSCFTKKTNMRMVGLEELLENSDIISLNCDLNETSRHILDKQNFSLMKQKPVVINTARGPLIDEVALVDALEKEIISGAGQHTIA